MPGTPLRVLIAEDSADDAELVRRQFAKAHQELVFERVETEAQMRAALDRAVWDVVISDHSMPGFDARTALRLLHESGRDTPFIVVSGRIGEDVAVAMMKAGAHDYVLKDNLARLMPAVERELREAGFRAEKRAADQEKARLEQERDALLARLKEENADLAALTAVTTNAISTLELDQLLQVLLSRVVAGMHADAGAILLAHGDELRIEASAGVVDLNDPGYVRRIGEGFAGTVASRRKPMYVEDAQTDPLISPPFRKTGIRTLLGVPLKSRNTLVGVLHVHWLSVRPFSERAMHLLEITAERCAAAVVNAQLYGQAKRAAEALAESEARFRRVVESDMLGLVFWDAAGNVTDANGAFLEIMRYSREDIDAGRVLWADMMAPENREADLQVISGLARTGKCPPYEREYLRKDGSRVSVLVGMAGFPEQPGKGVAFVLDITTRRQAEKELQQSEQRFRSIFEAEPECVKLLDLNGSVVAMNAAGLAMLEAESLSDVQARPLQSFVVPEDRAAFATLLERTLAGETGLLEFEAIGLRGTRRWLEAHSSPIWDSEGRASMVMGVTRDITERRHAEAQLRASLQEKDALLKEVHHRVKNNLQVVTSLLRLETARTEEPGARRVLQDMRGRIMSMALLHESLYRTGIFGRVDLLNYVQKLATQLFQVHNADNGRARLVLDLSPAQADIDQAIPCGLIVNELLSNSLKHAFAEGQSGEVTLSMKEDAEGRLRLAVSDSGVGLPEDFEARRGKSLGLQLVSDLARQLGGSLEVGPGPGSRFAVSFTANLPIPAPRIP